MLRNSIKTHCNAMKTVVGRGSFGAIHNSAVANAKMGRNSDNSSDKENVDAIEKKINSFRDENANVSSKNVLKEHNVVICHKGQTDTSKVGLLCKAKIIRQMLKTEEHHLIDMIRDKQGNVSDVVWCPVYVRPDPSGKVARGGDEIPHHRCKTCGKIGLHLLNDGQKYRPCLRCAGWREEEIPAWYYHISCGHCA